MLFGIFNENVFQVSSAFLEDLDPRPDPPRDMGFNATALVATKSGTTYTLHCVEGTDRFQVRTGAVSKEIRVGPSHAFTGLKGKKSAQTAYVFHDDAMIDLVNLIVNSLTSRRTRIRDLDATLPPAPTKALHLYTSPSGRDLLYVTMGTATSKVLVIDPGATGALVATIPVSTGPSLGVGGP